MLGRAAGLVAGDRIETYGSPVAHFSRVARIWSEILGTEVRPGQVIECMIALKLMRLAHNPEHADSWVDVAGYAACGYAITRGGPDEKS